MDWDKLRIFHASAEAGSFTHAGDTLNLSQSAVSRQVSALERELSVTLFHRHARGLKLTEEGELLYRTAHDVFNKLQTTKTMLQDTKEKPFGELRVHTTVGIGSVWLPQRIGEFVDMYPDIALELVLDDDEIDLTMGQTDVGIWLKEPAQKDLIRRPLFVVHMHVFASPKYLRQFGTPDKLADLDEHRILVYGPDAPSYLRNLNWLATAGRAGEKPREPALRINSVFGLKRAVREGVGLAVLPDYLIGRAPDLVHVPLEDAELPEFQTFFVYAEELRNSKRVNVFRDFLVDKSRQWKF
ncbi:MAG: LysR family transcriptional regulator [Hyphomicrobiaceae bacterium]